MSKLFNRVKGFAHRNTSALKIALASGLLLGSTALSSDFISSALGASLVLATSLYALTKSGDLSVDNVSGLGEKLKISPLMIGLGVGALASVPELLVAIKSVFTGASDIGIGQLVGANIAHVFLILGATAAIGKGIVKGKGLGWKFNTYAMAGTTLLFGGLIGTGALTPPVGIGMCALAAAYLGANFLINKRDAKKLGLDHKAFVHSHGDDDHHHHHDQSVLSQVFNSGLSIGALVLGAHMAVDSAQYLASSINIDPAITGTLAIALGVSLPELTFNLQAARKGKTEMAVGNVLGCNIFNILFVGGALSLAGTTVPESMSWSSDLGKFNLAALLTSATLMSATLLSGKGSIKKWQGMAGLAVYGAYVAANAGLGGYNYEKPKEPTAIVEQFNQNQDAQTVPSVKSEPKQLTTQPISNKFKLLPNLK